MKMMNGMMDMHGNMIEIDGMKMTNQTMDMNSVMYPETTGDGTREMKDTEMGMKMAEDNSGIVTLNYGMLRAPEKQHFLTGPKES